MIEEKHADAGLVGEGQGDVPGNLAHVEKMSSILEFASRLELERSTEGSTLSEDDFGCHVMVSKTKSYDDVLLL